MPHFGVLCEMCFVMFLLGSTGPTLSFIPGCVLLQDATLSSGDVCAAKSGKRLMNNAG